MQILFWVSLCVIIYTYLGYPLVICVLSALCPSRVNKQVCTPAVSILIAAYNEEANIAKTIQNKLELDYPKDRVEIILVSDASVDATDIIAEEFSKRTEGQVTLLRQYRSGEECASVRFGARTDTRPRPCAGAGAAAPPRGGAGSSVGPTE